MKELIQNLVQAAVQGDVKTVEDLVLIDQVPVDGLIALRDIDTKLRERLELNLSYFGNRAVNFCQNRRGAISNVTVNCKFVFSPLLALIVSMLLEEGDDSAEKTKYAQHLDKQKQVFIRLLQLGAVCNLQLTFEVEYDPPSANRSDRNSKWGFTIDVIDVLLLTRDFKFLTFFLGNSEIRAKLRIPGHRPAHHNYHLFVDRRRSEDKEESFYLYYDGTIPDVSNSFALAEFICVAQYAAIIRHNGELEDRRPVITKEQGRQLKLDLSEFAAATLSDGIRSLSIVEDPTFNIESWRHLLDIARKAGKSDDEISTWLMQSWILESIVKQLKHEILAEMLTIFSKTLIERVINDRYFFARSLFDNIPQFRNGTVVNDLVLTCIRHILNAACDRQINIDIFFAWSAYIPEHASVFTEVWIKAVSAKGANPKKLLNHEGLQITYAEYWLRGAKIAPLKVWLQMYPEQFVDQKFAYKPSQGPVQQLSAVGIVLRRYATQQERTDTLKVLFEFGITAKVADFIFCLDMLRTNRSSEAEAYITLMLEHADLYDVFEGRTLLEVAVHGDHAELMRAVIKQLGSQPHEDLEHKFHLSSLLNVTIDKNQLEAIKSLVGKLNAKPQPSHLARCLEKTPCNREIYTFFILECGVDVTSPEVQKVLATKGNAALSNRIADLGNQYIAAEQQKRLAPSAAPKPPAPRA